MKKSKMFAERFKKAVKSIYYRVPHALSGLGPLLGCNRLTSCKGTSYIEYFIAAAAMSVATAVILSNMSGQNAGDMFGGYFDSFFQ